MIGWKPLIRSVLLALVILGTQLSVATSAPAPPLPAPFLAGVTTDRAGHVYVADARKGRIYVLSQDLQLLAVWTIPRPRGPSDVHLEGVAVDQRGTIYATDLNDRIFKFTSRGTVQAVWGSPGSGPGQFRQAWGIAVGARDNVLVADTFNHRVQKLSPAGKPRVQWQIYSPYEFPGGPCGLEYLAVDPRGRVYLTDDCYGRVFKLAPSGRVLQIWGQPKRHGPGQFSGIAGVAVGPGGNVFVAETCRILKFTPSGKLLASSRESGYPGHPFSPAGIAIDARGFIYVADAENYRVIKLSPSSQTPAVRCLRHSGCKGSYASGLRTRWVYTVAFTATRERGGGRT